MNALWVTRDGDLIDLKGRKSGIRLRGILSPNWLAMVAERSLHQNECASGAEASLQQKGGAKKASPAGTSARRIIYPRSPSDPALNAKINSIVKAN